MIRQSQKTCAWDFFNNENHDIQLIKFRKIDVNMFLNFCWTNRMEANVELLFVPFYSNGIWYLPVFLIGSNALPEYRARTTFYFILYVELKWTINLIYVLKIGWILYVLCNCCRRTTLSIFCIWKNICVLIYICKWKYIYIYIYSVLLRVMKRTKFLLAVIYRSFRRHSNSLKTFRKYRKKLIWPF